MAVGGTNGLCLVSGFVVAAGRRRSVYLPRNYYSSSPRKLRPVSSGLVFRLCLRKGAGPFATPRSRRSGFRRGDKDRVIGATVTYATNGQPEFADKLQEKFGQ